MTKHNGKARKSGTSVGAALANRQKKGGPISTSAMFRHTTDITNGQSILERGDLDELMAMADLADRDFTADRGQAVVISTGTVDPLAQERDTTERREAEDRHRHRLRIPRRPHWTSDMTADQLDLQERTSFLSWRRDLAMLEEEEKLVLTPFERNLEVWRQLWRVLERSDIVVQVLDSRDPLLYRSTDLEAYATEILDTKASFMLLNKSDLLPENVRKAWADHFDSIGMPYAFWSAFQVSEEQQALRHEASELGLDVHDLRIQRAKEKERAYERRRAKGLPDPRGDDPRLRILDADELLELLEDKAREAVEAAGPDDPRILDPERRFVVGLVGYPNVGKSSTINALFGSKKTAVAPTPGKTKHFQTLNVSTTLCLCDCPGLVMPVFANSKAEMVAAGVIPIDRLTDIRNPVEVVAKRLGRWQFADLYGIKVPPPLPHEPSNTPLSAQQLLRSLAVSRGWTAGSGLPDESRSGRVILRDYTSGKLLYCVLPPGFDPSFWIPGRKDEEEDDDEDEDEEVNEVPSGALPDDDGLGVMSVRQEDTLGHDPQIKYTVSRSFMPLVSDRPSPLPPSTSSGGSQSRPGASSRAQGKVPLDAADLAMLAEMEAERNGGLSRKRPEYKFNKKAARSKGDRGQGTKGEGAGDGWAMITGKKGGLKHVTGY